MTAVGFEPTRIAPPELESGALDRSAKLSPAASENALLRRTTPASLALKFDTSTLNQNPKNEARAIRTPNRLIWFDGIENVVIQLCM